MSRYIYVFLCPLAIPAIDPAVSKERAVID